MAVVETTNTLQGHILALKAEERIFTRCGLGVPSLEM